MVRAARIAPHPDPPGGRPSRSPVVGRDLGSDAAAADDWDMKGPQLLASMGLAAYLAVSPVGGGLVREFGSVPAPRCLDAASTTCALPSTKAIPTSEIRRSPRTGDSPPVPTRRVQISSSCPREPGRVAGVSVTGCSWTGVMRHAPRIARRPQDEHRHSSPSVQQGSSPSGHQPVACEGHDRHGLNRPPRGARDRERMAPWARQYHD